jgi:hypothetical protein
MIVIKEPADFKRALAGLRIGHGALSTIMKRLGDDRPRQNIRRNLRRMAAGEARVSGEMRALLNVLDILRRANPDAYDQLRAPKDDCLDDDEAPEWQQEGFIR